VISMLAYPSRHIERWVERQVSPPLRRMVAFGE
jgi:hypothetical protein